MVGSYYIHSHKCLHLHLRNLLLVLLFVLPLHQLLSSDNSPLVGSEVVELGLDDLTVPAPVRRQLSQHLVVRLPLFAGTVMLVPRWTLVLPKRRRNPRYRPTLFHYFHLHLRDCQPILSEVVYYSLLLLPTSPECPSSNSPHCSQTRPSVLACPVFHQPSLLLLPHLPLAPASQLAEQQQQQQFYYPRPTIPEKPCPFRCNMRGGRRRRGSRLRR